jgi:hypothetical protein
MTDPGHPVALTVSGGPTSAKLRGPLHQLPEPRVVSRRIERGVDPKPSRREVGRQHPEQRLELVQRLLGLAGADGRSSTGAKVCYSKSTTSTVTPSGNRSCGYTWTCLYRMGVFS